jgi:hypothetical protein
MDWILILKKVQHVDDNLQGVKKCQDSIAQTCILSYELSLYAAYALWSILYSAMFLAFFVLKFGLHLHLYI